VGHRRDPIVADALDAVKKKANSLEVIGSYPHAASRIYDGIDLQGVARINPSDPIFTSKPIRTAPKSDYMPIDTVIYG